MKDLKGYSNLPKSPKGKTHSGGLAPKNRKVLPSRLNVTKSSSFMSEPKRNYGSGGKGISKSKFSK